MKRFLVLILLLLPIMVMAQDGGEDATNDFGALRIDILAPGVSYEFQISELTTTVVGVRLAFLTGSTDIAGQQETYFLMAPSFHSEFRYFFNRPKRIRKGKSVYNNSGLFIGASAAFNSRDIYSNTDIYVARVSASFGPVFGVQRTWKNNLQLGISLGYGLAWDEVDDTYISGIGSFNFSYVFVPKKDK